MVGAVFFTNIFDGTAQSINLFILIHTSPRLRHVEKDPQFLEKLQDIAQNSDFLRVKDIDRMQSIVFETTFSDTV